MTDRFKAYYLQHPLRVICFSGLLFRLISAVFSRGYGFSDDHFLVIEVAEQWLSGIDSKGWMPWNGNTSASGHSLFYPGLHHYFFYLLNYSGITNPEVKMFIVRVIHALYSMLIVIYGYKISHRLDGKTTANAVGWLLALLWFMPMLSVRNLVEMVCIPPILIAVWMVISAADNAPVKRFLLAGVIAGLAFSVRFQAILLVGGLGLALLIQRRWLAAFFYGTGAILCMALLQAGIDTAVWGRPFAEFREYTLYNINHSGDYPNGPWYLYVLFLSGVLIPPVSLFIFTGIFRSFRSYLPVLLPAIIFFIFHSYFPNKQERFILPVVPFFIIAGVGGWNRFVVNSLFWQKRKQLLNGILIWFWSINLLLLCLITPSSTKTSRIDAMNYLREKGDCERFVLEGSVMLPLFYSGSWNEGYEISDKISASALFDSLYAYHKPLPTYIIFAEAKNLEMRVAAVRPHVKSLTFETEIQSSYLDRVMTFLNPVNVSQTYYIYKISY